MFRLLTQLVTKSIDDPSAAALVLNNQVSTPSTPRAIVLCRTSQPYSTEFSCGLALAYCSYPVEYSEHHPVLPSTCEYCRVVLQAAFGKAGVVRALLALVLVQAHRPPAEIVLQALHVTTLAVSGNGPSGSALSGNRFLGSVLFRRKHLYTSGRTRAFIDTYVRRRYVRVCTRLCTSLSRYREYSRVLTDALKCLGTDGVRRTE